jgi:hypothetical protein
MTGPLVLTTGAIGFGVITMLVAYALVSGVLRREIRAAWAGHYAPEIGYRRYMAASMSIVRPASLIALLVPLVSVILVINDGNMSEQLFSEQLLGNVLAGNSEGVVFGYIIGLFGALYTIPLSAYDLLAVPMGMRALAELRGIRLPEREALGYTGKRVLVAYVPALALCEATGAAAVVNIGAGIAVLLVGLVAVVVLRRTLATALTLWIIPSLPIERTPWAALGPRIREWGRLTGTEVRTTYVQQTVRLGTGSVAAVGPRSRRVLFIGDALLGNTDWRQQDSLIVYTLSRSTSITRRSQLTRTLIPLGLLAALMVILVVLLLLLQNDAAVSPLVLLTFVLVALALVLALLVFAIFNAIVGRRRARKRLLAADARAVALTGDPLGLMVALNTLSALSGMPTDRHLGYIPSIAERVAALDALLRQPGPRAPYAAQPVPSLMPVYVGPYCLTVPLAAGAPSAPAPVPAGAYPIVMPPTTAPAAVVPEPPPAQLS